jgi:hypothetical protein
MSEPSSSTSDDRLKIFFGGATLALKALTVFFLFSAVIIVNIVSKGSILLAASNLRPSADSVNQSDLWCTNTNCVAIPRPFQYYTGNLTCLAGSYLHRAQQCVVYRVMWAWALLLMVCVPYALVFVRCLWRVVFKKKANPTLKALAFSMTVETLHAIGSSIFTFTVLPSLDNAIQVCWSL